MFKNTELIGAARRLRSVGDWQQGSRGQNMAASLELCTGMALIEKPSEQAGLCGAHTRQEEANTEHTGQAAFTKCDGIS